MGRICQCLCVFFLFVNHYKIVKSNNSQKKTKKTINQFSINNSTKQNKFNIAVVNIKVVRKSLFP